MNEEELFKKKTIAAFVHSFGGLFAGTGIQFISSIFLARLLLPSDYGLLGMVTIFIAISQIFIDGGMSQALIRERNVTQTDLSTVFFYNLVLSILSYSFLFVSARTISNFFREPVLVLIIRFVGLNLIIGAFGIIQRTILIRHLEFKIQTILDVVASILSGALAISLAYHGFGVWALIIQSLFSQILVVAMFSVYNKWIPSLIFDIDSFKRLFGFGWKMLMTSLLATAYQNFYNVIIGRIYVSELGFYTKSKQLVELASTSITTTVSKVSYPALSQIQENENMLRASFRKLIKIISFVTFPMMIGLAVVAKPLVTFIFGENWVPMVPYFQLLCFSSLTYPHRAFNLDILRVKGRSDIFLQLDLLKICLGLIMMGFAVVLKLGIFALLWITFINSQIAFLVNSFFSKKFISYSTLEQLKDMIPSLVASLLMGGIVWLFGALTHFGSFSTLVIQITIGIISYFCLGKLLKIEELNSIYLLLGPKL